MRARPLHERLAEKLVLDENGCWLFTGFIRNDGYGYIEKGFGVHMPIGAHVASWMVHYGDVPRGLSVCHKCNVRACCNPEHLYLGTHQDNMHDRRKKNMTADHDDYVSEQGSRQEPSKPSLSNSMFSRKFDPPEDIE